MPAVKGTTTASLTDAPSEIREHQQNAEPARASWPGLGRRLRAAPAWFASGLLLRAGPGLIRRMLSTRRDAPPASGAQLAVGIQDDPLGLRGRE
jgi:hypothetical protein